VHFNNIDGQNNAVSRVSCYGLDYPGWEPLRARFCAPIQTGPEAHPAFCTMGPFMHVWYYSPFWTLSSLKKRFHFCLSLGHLSPFLDTNFYGMRFRSHAHPQISSPLTCPAWKTLPLATPSPALLSVSVGWVPGLFPRVNRRGRGSDRPSPYSAGSSMGRAIRLTPSVTA
jgi:hypothetical protein